MMIAARQIIRQALKAHLKIDLKAHICEMIERILNYI